MRSWARKPSGIFVPHKPSSPSQKFESLNKEYPKKFR
jgi:hypothetical protein